MPPEYVRDNQWWYSQSVHRPRVENCMFVVLSIGGRECPLIHSKLGCDGRATHSFRFLNPTDRTFWSGLRGNEIDIEVIECGEQIPDIHQADEVDLPDQPCAAELLEVSPVSRSTDTLFDAYIFVDWSAASRPKTGTDSIWIAEGVFDKKLLVVSQPTNPRTRQQAEAEVRDMLRQHTQLHRRVLIGFDFPYGYPAQWHAALGLASQGNWQTLWSLFAQRITDDAQNANNRCDVANDLNAAVAQFVGPFWSRPNANAAAYPALPATKPPCFGNGIVEFREIDRQLKNSGKHPKSVWQLFGNGAVGSQALLGIPVLHRLRNDDQLEPCSQVWPFESGWQCPTGQRPFVLHSEIWPGAIDVMRGLHAVKDAAQVLSYVYWAARRDVVGHIGACFNPHAPAAVVQFCEGWILGQ